MLSPVRPKQTADEAISSHQNEKLGSRITFLRSLLASVALISFSTLASQAQTATQLFAFACPPQQFTTCVDGDQPNALIQASDGNFYGAAQLTVIGSSNPQGGTLFKITPSGKFTLLFTFKADSHGNYLNGNNPASGMVEGNDGFIYGTSFEGGNTDNGVLFRIAKGGTGFEVVHSFCGAPDCADGSLPIGLIVGHDGNIYGSTAGGGANGTLYRFSPTSGFATISTTGFGQALRQGTDGNFYGVAGREVLRISPNGTTKVLASFPEVDGFLPTNGASGLTQASNGKLYGAVTTYSLNQAQFYDVAPSGAGFQEFPQIGTLSVDFEISTLIQASDGNLWTAFTTTSNGNGSVFVISPSTGQIVKTFEFDGPNGSLPEAGVVQGADGKIYGTTIGGGVVSDNQQPSGTVWVLDAGLRAPAATVGGFAPSSGAVGTTVLIRGSHMIGTTAVTFNGVEAAFKVLNTNFVSATVPAGATSGPIAVTNPGGKTVTAAHFVIP